MASKGSVWERLGNVLSIGVVIITLVASFFLTGEDNYPGAFYVQRQALWNDGSYGRNFTFMITWFTLLSLVAVPLLFVVGLVAMLRRWSSPVTEAPAGWDVRGMGRRLKLGAGGLLLIPVWAIVTGIVVVVPEWFSPLGGFAAISLLVLPFAPIAIEALLFEALIPPSYVEGAIEGMRFTGNENQTITVRLHVAGRSYLASPKLLEGLGLGQGTRVGLLAGGFSKRVQRIARLP